MEYYQIEIKNEQIFNRKMEIKLREIFLLGISLAVN
jgi:hypothetical protein